MGITTSQRGLNGYESCNAKDGTFDSYVSARDGKAQVSHDAGDKMSPRSPVPVRPRLCKATIERQESHSSQYVPRGHTPPDPTKRKIREECEAFIREASARYNPFSDIVRGKRKMERHGCLKTWTRRGNLDCIKRAFKEWERQDSKQRISVLEMNGEVMGVVTDCTVRDGRIRLVHEMVSTGLLRLVIFGPEQIDLSAVAARFVKAAEFVADWHNYLNKATDVSVPAQILGIVRPVKPGDLVKPIGLKPSPVAVRSDEYLSRVRVNVAC